jgi:hypothetical protein
MCLVALQDPGLTVYPTHRLAGGVTAPRRRALAALLERDFSTRPADDPDPGAPDGGPLRMGYVARGQRPAILTLRDQAIADAALAGRPEPYRRLDSAVLEALVLKGPLELTDDDISHLRRFGYARTVAQARELVEAGTFDLAFVLRPTPVDQVREVAAAGASMPPKSTYFYPKLPTGLLVNPLA